MSTTHFATLFPAVCAGFGLLLAGGANLLLLGRGGGVRVLATLAAFGVAVGAASALDVPGVPGQTILYLAIGAVPFLLLGSRRVVDVLAAVVAFLPRPAVRFSLLALTGVGLVVGSVVVFEQADEQAIDNSVAELEISSGVGPTIAATQGKAVTDQGTAVVLKEPELARAGGELTAAENRALRTANLDEHVIRRGPVGNHSNCHGWVFTGGKYLLSPDDVELILKENGYEAVHEPHPGDVVIYRSGGTISHSAVVRYVSEGQPVLVEGKWGHLGIFLHPADRSLYGNDFTFYRSGRPGHLLSGVGGPTRPTTAPPVLATE